MIFASFEFLFLFLPVFFAIYFLTPFRYKNITILVFSWAFYGWWRVDFLALLAGVTVFTFVVAKAMGKAGHESPRAKQLMVFGIVVILGVLAWFKYANFGVDSFNDAVALLGWAPIPWAAIVLPIGLSFYVLQSVSYLVDIRRGDVTPTESFIDYAAYKALFSQLIAGPIVRYADIAEELRARVHTLAQFGAGARKFMIGFAMKVVLADTVNPIADAAFVLANPTLADAWIGAVAYTLQLFFDFAGYSLMAIGLGLMVGFHFPRNFQDPYLAGSIQNFWQRWHMTLSRFLRDYLYIPLGGSRLGETRTYINLMATMVIGGFWHGASWNFVIWGFWHGGLLTLHRWWSTRPGATPLPWWLGHAITLVCVIIGWVIFRAHDLKSAIAMYTGMAGLNGFGLSDELAWQITPDRAWAMPIAIFFVYLPGILALLAPRLPHAEGAGFGSALARVWWVFWPLAAFALSMVLLYSRAAVPFLYFQF